MSVNKKLASVCSYGHRECTSDKPSSELLTDKQNRFILMCQKYTEKNSKVYHQNVAVAKNIHFSYEGSTGDIEESFDNPLEFFFNRETKNFPSRSQIVETQFSL